MTVRWRGMIIRLLAKFKKSPKQTGYSADSCCGMVRPKRFDYES